MGVSQENAPRIRGRIRAGTDAKGRKEMECFQVVEWGEGIETAIRRGLGRRGGVTGPCIAGEHPALLVVSPRAARLERPLPPACRTLLLPGEAVRLPGGLRAASAVSYGPSPRDSLTISSRERDRLWAALQRDVVTVDGRVVERQEFSVPLEGGEDLMPALAAVGALVLLGVPPEELEHFLIS